MKRDVEKAFGASVELVRRLADEIALLPAAEREAALGATQSLFAAEIGKFDRRHEPLAREWARLQMEGLRALVREMESGRSELPASGEDQGDGLAAPTPPRLAE